MQFSIDKPELFRITELEFKIQTSCEEIYWEFYEVCISQNCIIKEKSVEVAKFKFRVYHLDMSVQSLTILQRGNSAPAVDYYNIIVHQCLIHKFETLYCMIERTTISLCYTYYGLLHLFDRAW